MQPRAPRRGRRRPARRRRRRHPGADPAPVLQAQGRGARHRAAGARPLRGRLRVHAARGGGAQKRPGHLRRRRGARGPDAHRLARGAVRRFLARRLGQADWRPSTCRCSSAAARTAPPTTTFERRLYIIRKSISNVVFHKRDPKLAHYYVVSLSCRTIVYKGMFLADQLGKYYPDLHEDDFEFGAGARAPALLHQHVPELAAGASVPHDLPQRRDQHAARQRQLDGGAAGLGRLANCSATTSRSCGRSPTRASPTPPASTTRSNSWCRAATRSRTR